MSPASNLPLPLTSLVGRSRELESIDATYAEAGLSLGDVRRTVFELHKLVAGDLMGVPQPA